MAGRGIETRGKKLKNRLSNMGKSLNTGEMALKNTLLTRILNESKLNAKVFYLHKSKSEEMPCRVA